MALAWWLVMCLPFPGLPYIYFLFTVRLANERVGVFLTRHSVQHLVMTCHSSAEYAEFRKQRIARLLSQNNILAVTYCYVILVRASTTKQSGKG
jgi:predicted metalloenzyme YecM